MNDPYYCEPCGEGSTSSTILAYKYLTPVGINVIQAIYDALPALKTSGRTLLSGIVNPDVSIGSEGDYYINNVTHFIWGPKTATNWPSTGLSLVGPIGTSVTSRALLAAVPSPTSAQIAYLAEAGREGTFVFSAANLSAMVTADPQKAVYIAPNSDTTGTSGAWVRTGFDRMDIEWFGGVAIPQTSWAVPANHAAYDIQPALEAFQTLARAGLNNSLPGLHKLRLPGRAYYSSKWEIVNQVDIEGGCTSDQGYRATYVRGPVNAHLWVVNRHNTYNGGTVVSGTYGGADGSSFRGIHFLGASGTITATGYYGTSGVNSTSGSAIWFRARGYVKYCQANFFGSHGFQVLAYAGGGGAIEGNANSCRFDDCLSSYNGGVGFFFQGADANVGRTHNCFADTNRLGGLWDLSFLGGGSHEIETQFNGVTDQSNTVTRKTGARSYSAKNYSAVYGQEAGAATNPPSGTTAHNTWWWYISSASTTGIPAWTSGEVVEASPDILTNAGSTQVPIYAYVEGNSYGFIQVTRGTLLIAPAIGLPVFGGGDILSSGQGDTGVNSGAFNAGSANLDYITMGSRTDPTQVFRISYNGGNGPLVCTRSGANLLWGYTGNGALMSWNGPFHATNPNTLIPNQFALPVGSNSNEFRRFGYINSTADLAGRVLDKGDIFFFTGAAATSAMGVYCTTTGLGGTTAVLTNLPALGLAKAAAQVDSVATTIAGVVADFNALLAKLRTAGLMS